MDERKSLLFYCLSVRTPRARQELLVICALRVDNGSLAQLVELGVNNRNSCLTVVAGSSPAGALYFNGESCMQYTEEELKKIIENHQHWIKEDCEGWEDMQANLAGAYLVDANLKDANLKDEDFRLGKILTEPLTGYKKTKEGVVITAEIPAGAIVFCINGSKCRTNRAKITDMTGKELLHSSYDPNFEYRLGQEIEIKNFNLMYNVECASGFHFFRKREEAEKYNA